ncbi:hypothetical protein IU451_28635 [Nocardia cyriacigeorgica]|uniref:hypothetical protein n=1 Tax=Nocardia cyriacigeorgica TaxID=135487 RepID=UPI0018937E76|nr:hypothetical protein [Nocardia cyriacigeorgica]MBF6326469.1 hypothetical protein [Nocardia cyriacigeorgica]
MTDQMIARAAGTSIQPVGRIRRQMTTRVQTRVAEAILGVDLHAHRQQALVLNVGCRRRIEALHVMGHSGTVIGKHVDVKRATVSRWRMADRVYLETFDLIRGVYDKLWDVDGGCVRTKNWAADNGWTPPMGWTDIDDPYEQPAVVEDSVDEDIDEMRVERIIAGAYIGPTTRDEKAAVYDHAIENGWLPAKVAEHLGMTKEAAERAILRRKAKLRKQEAA